MTALVTITAGIGEDCHGVPLAPETVDRALALIRASLANWAGGYTETDAMGGWVNGAGELVTERAKRWTVATDEPEHADRIAAYVRRTLRQQSVMVEVAERSTVRFIEAPAEARAAA